MAGASITLNDLPGVIPVFPLDGVLLPARGLLPLNIFEPRYLNMVDDAMAGDRIIGMVQTRPGGDRERPLLAAVGGAGRITSFSETPDGRYLLTLTGLCRFRLGPELTTPSPYRQVRADFAPFSRDLDGGEDPADLDRAPLLSALRRYLVRRNMEIDWQAAAGAPLEGLINSLAMALPFTPQEKQALLESLTTADRAQTLAVLLNIDAASEEGDGSPPVQ
jgi:Lon protease-like protein